MRHLHFDRAQCVHQRVGLQVDLCLQIGVQQPPGGDKCLSLRFQIFLKNVTTRSQAKDALRHPVDVRLQILDGVTSFAKLDTLL